MKGKRIDHIGIVVEDLESASRFATEILGLSKDGEAAVPGRLKANFFRCGDGLLEFIEVLDPKLREQRLGSARARVEHVAIEVDEAFAARDDLRRRGVEMTEDEPLVTGGRRSFFTRPDTAEGVMYQVFDRQA